MGRWSPGRAMLPGGCLLVGLCLFAVAATGFPSSGTPAQALSEAAPAGAATTLTAAIAAEQRQLKDTPADDSGWASLAVAYVQEARVTADPSYYARADGALRRSFALRPDANVGAMTGMGVLANARHDFAAGLAWGLKAQAADPYDATALAVQDDANTQLGNYPAADTALQRMLALQPGIASFTRASYHFEEQGRDEDARVALDHALAQATDPADIDYCRYYLGELDFNTGHPAAALAQYELGLAAKPDSVQSLEGRAKAEGALGRTTAAVTDYATVTSRVPLPQYVLEYGELLQSLGRNADAQAQYRLLAAEQRIWAAGGVLDDLTAATFAADHGRSADALAHAQIEWGRRHSVLVADALAWALHRSGRNAEALVFAREATRLGWHNAGFSYHLGMIELSLGQRAAARVDLAAALSINPYFSPLQAAVARQALRTLT